MAEVTNLENLKAKLPPLIENSPKILFLGIGENRMGDDGAGQYLAFELDQWCQIPQIKIINGGITPENRLEEIVAFKPEIIFILDAMETDQPPGTIDIFEEDRMRMYLPISTHSLPLPIFLDHIRSILFEVRIYLIGVVPFGLEFSDHYEMFQEDRYDLDAYDQNPNLPFYAFHMTSDMENLLSILINGIKEILTNFYLI